MNVNNPSFSFIDLFAGIGGFKMALETNNGYSLGYSEINKDAISTYCENFAEEEDSNLGDIKTIENLPSHDLLTAGVPCQSWSIAGKNLGFDDDRGQLWNDTLFLLQQSQPQAFIFENVKGLVDPRNEKALSHILARIKDAGYFADYYTVNSYDHGVPQNRIRVYIIGFKDETFFKNFNIPKYEGTNEKLANILGVKLPIEDDHQYIQKDLFGNVVPIKSMSLSSKNGFNDYFLFNDLRNGDTTIHTWDILETTDRQKHICYVLLKNRRKKTFGKLDGNPLSIKNFQSIDKSIQVKELRDLIKLEILKEEKYLFSVTGYDTSIISGSESYILDLVLDSKLNVDDLKSNKTLKINNIKILDTLKALEDKNIIKCVEIRYDFKNTKISTGLFGVNRIFLPSSNLFPTLVASDTNDFVTLEPLKTQNKETYRSDFIDKIYNKGNYRKITKEEACLIQGFPKSFKLPEARARWMKLIGNSVSVPVIDVLCKAIIQTGVFNQAISARTKSI